MKKQKNKFSHLTAIERIYLSVPAQFLLDKNMLQGKVLDFGCGFGNDRCRPTDRSTRWRT